MKCLYALSLVPEEDPEASPVWSLLHKKSWAWAAPPLSNGDRCLT